MKGRNIKMKKYWKKGISILISCSLIMGTSMPIFAAEAGTDKAITGKSIAAMVSGSCGKNVKWKLSEDGIMTISGTGAMTNYAYGGTPWESYRSDIETIIIENGVTKIGSSAFAECYYVTEIVIPASVTSIGEYAFCYCSNLEKITFEGDAPNISNDAFFGVTAKVSYPKDNSTWTAEMTQCYGGKLDWGIREGSCGKNAKWKLSEDGTLTISGTGAMADYNSEESPWYFARNNIQSIIIEAGITSIGDYAFAWTNNLSEITIPSSVTSIGKEAFFYCEGLLKVTISDGVKNIEDEAFCGCYQLTEITIPSSVTSIGKRAFSGCHYMSQIIFEGNAPSIEEDAFGDVRAKVSYPKNDATWTRELMLNYGGGLDWGIREGSCGKNVTWEFSEDETLTIRGTGPMNDYDGLKAPWNFCIYDMKSVIIEEGVTSIGKNAFCYAYSMKEAIISSSVVSIGERAFSSCNDLEEIVIPSGVTSIGESAFSGCSRIEKIIFEGDAPSINIYAFDGVSAKVFYPKNNPTWTDEVMVSYGGTLDWGKQSGTYGENLTWEVSEGTVLTIRGTGPMPERQVPWASYMYGLKSIIIESGVTSISAYAFEDFTSLTEITIPNSVTSIGESALNSCNNLTEITIPSSVISIGADAFRNCYNLDKITFEGDAPSIGANAFRYVSADVSYPKNNPTWTSKMLVGYGGTLDWGIREGNCGENVTWHLSEDGTLTISGTGSMTDYGEGQSPWFDSCIRKIESVVIEHGVTSIGAYVFYYCYNLTKVSISDSVTNIEDFAFFYCYNLSEITIPNRVTRIESNAFAGCSSLREIIIPNSVKSIGKYAFEFCRDVAKITFEGDAPSMDYDSFGGITADVFYPKDNPTWTSEVMQDYGGTLTWIAYGGDVTTVFSDVAEWDWFKDAVQYVYDNGMMSGHDSLFDPLGNMTRAMMVTTLYRLAGEPAVTDKTAINIFDDMEDGQWYTDAVCWAYNTGITTGYTERSMFGVDDNVTREQLAVFLYRYADKCGYDVSASADITGYAGCWDVSDYAQDAIRWAVGIGVISGIESNVNGNLVYDLAPQGSASRAQLATILMRFCNYYE